MEYMTIKTNSKEQSAKLYCIHKYSTTRILVEGYYIFSSITAEVTALMDVGKVEQRE